MRIGLDVSQTGHLKKGCGYFADSLARHLVVSNPDSTYILYPTFGHGYWDATWRQSTLQMPERSNVRRGPGQRSLDQLEAFWMEPPPDLESRLGSPDIIHSNNFFCPTSLTRARLVYTLHDLAFVAHPEWTSEANWRTCFEGVVNASAYADHVVAVSDYTRRQFLELFPRFSPERMSVVHEASRFEGPGGDRVPPRSLAHLRPGEFWLAVDTADPRKNTARLMDAYARLRSRGETTYPLVLFGGTEAVSGSIESRDVQPYVKHLGYVDDTSLRWLYENCTAFCYPSLFEGFGLPVVEAMSLGAPVLTSNVTSIPEVVGDCALLVDPSDLASMYAALRQLANDDFTRRRLHTAGIERAKQFSWKSAASHVLDVYRELLNQYSRNSGRKALLGVIER